jgi:biotin carboxyl carrier protein
LRYFVTLGAREIPIDVTTLPGGGLDVRVDGRPVSADLVAVGDALSIRLDGRVIDLAVEGEPPMLGIVASGHRAYVKAESDRMRAASAARGRAPTQGDDVVVSPMPGRIVKVLVAKGDDVEAGAPLVVVEAMKMENELVAGKKGTIAEVFVKPGDTVNGGEKLVALG